MTDFPPVYCLTLPEEAWKGREAALEFCNQGLEAIFFSGFNGLLTGLRPTTPFQYNLDGSPEFAHLAQVGSAISHIAMLKSAISSGASEFICCEDDIEFFPDFSNRWSQIRNSMPELDVVQLEYIPVQSANQPPIREFSVGLSQSANYAHCAGCIWWTREAAVEATKLLRPIDNPYDLMLMRRVYPFMRHALATPPLARQKTAYGKWPSSIGIAAGKSSNETRTD